MMKIEFVWDRDADVDVDVDADADALSLSPSPSPSLSLSLFFHSFILSFWKLTGGVRALHSKWRHPS
jgi:hypothetical protein